MPNRHNIKTEGTTAMGTRLFLRTVANPAITAVLAAMSYDGSPSDWFASPFVYNMDVSTDAVGFEWRSPPDPISHLVAHDQHMVAHLSSGSDMLHFVSGPAPVGGVALSSILGSLCAREQLHTENFQVSWRFSKITVANTVEHLARVEAGVELTPKLAHYDVAADVSGKTLAEGERLLLSPSVINVPGQDTGSGYVWLLGGNTLNHVLPSYIDFPETIAFGAP